MKADPGGPVLTLQRSVRSAGNRCSGGASVVALRELQVANYLTGPDDKAGLLRELAALPHFERLNLNGRLSRTDLPLLESLPQLRSLRLAVSPDDDGYTAAVGALHLPLLHSLELHYSGASCRLTAEGGLRSLLALPALTHLRLPHVSADTLAHLRLLAACSDHQPPVRIERSPLPSPLEDSPWRILSQRMGAAELPFARRRPRGGAAPIRTTMGRGLRLDPRDSFHLQLPSNAIIFSRGETDARRFYLENLARESQMPPPRPIASEEPAVAAAAPPFLPASPRAVAPAP